MTYSVESLVFRAVAGVVNTAARAANGLLKVMYPPRYDAAHIWDELERPPHEAAASADPHPADVADPAGARDAPPSPPAGSLTWEAWAVPAILDCLAEHLALVGADGHIYCYSDGEGVSSHGRFEDWELWREHVAPELAARIGCDPTRAVLALTSLQTQ